MKTPTKYTPYLLSISLALVFIAMITVTTIQNRNIDSALSLETATRLNKPGPAVKKTMQANTPPIGHPVFLKEDIKDEISPGSARLASNNNTAIVAATVTSVEEKEEAWMKRQIKIESNTIKGKDRFLVLIDQYTDNMMLLSKRGQYQVRGYDAEIIRFANEEIRYICLGRFAQERQAATFAKTVGDLLIVDALVYDKNTIVYGK